MEQVCTLKIAVPEYVTAAPVPKPIVADFCFCYISRMLTHMLPYAGTLRGQYTTAYLQQGSAAVTSSLQVSERGCSSALDHCIPPTLHSDASREHNRTRC